MAHSSKSGLVLPSRRPWLISVALSYCQSFSLADFQTEAAFGNLIIGLWRGSIASGLWNLSGVKSWLNHLLAVWPGASCLISQCLDMLTFKRNVMTIFISLGCSEAYTDSYLSSPQNSAWPITSTITRIWLVCKSLNVLVPHYPH